MRLEDVVTKRQLRWGDVAWAPVHGEWPGVAFARGTTAWSQLQKIDIDSGEAIISVCVGEHAEPQFKRKITGFSLPHHFTAPSRDIVEPTYFANAIRVYGSDRWPDSIACRAVFRFLDPPVIDQIVEIPRLVTGTRGRYLSDLSAAAPDLFGKIAALEIEELVLYKSQSYQLLSKQPRQSAYRQAGWTPTTPKNIQQTLFAKMRSIFASEAASGGVCQYVQSDRRVLMEETPFFLLLCELWDEQKGRCDYCQLPLEAEGLAQVRRRSY